MPIFLSSLYILDISLLLDVGLVKIISEFVRKLFISCRSSLVKFFGLLKYIVTLSANNDSLTSSFPNCISLTSLYCLIALARTSRTISENKQNGIYTMSELYIGFICVSTGRLSVCTILLVAQYLRDPRVHVN